MKPRALCALMSFVPVLVSPPALADPTSGDKAMATQLYDDADKEIRQGNFATACPKFGESQRLDPQLGTLLHLADCYEKAGKTASAWASFKDAIEIAARKNANGQHEPREKIARSRATALEARLSRIVVTVANPDTPGLEVKQDGVAVGRAVWGSGLPVDPGTHVLTAKAPGRTSWTKTVELPANGAKVDVAVPTLEPEATASIAAPPSPSPSASNLMESQPKPATDSPSSGGSQRVIGYTVVGVGVVGLVVGTVFALERRSALAEADALCPNNVCRDPNEVTRLGDLTSQARRDTTTSAIGFIAGGAALVGGGILVLTTPSSSEPAKTATLLLQPWAGSTSLGAAIAGRW